MITFLTIKYNSKCNTTTTTTTTAAAAAADNNNNYYALYSSGKIRKILLREQNLEIPGIMGHIKFINSLFLFTFAKNKNEFMS